MSKLSVLEENVISKVVGMDWLNITEQLAECGNSHLSQILSDEQCGLLVDFYEKNELFRNHIYLHRHGFGKGEYKYFKYPLPGLIAELRNVLYSKLVIIANSWNEQMKIDVRYPAIHQTYIDECHAAGQVNPTPLLLQYEKGDYNCLHQDLYGDLEFPLQAVFLLSEPGKDFTGGEFLITEQRPRMQTRAEVLDLKKGDAVIFAGHYRPQRGTHGFYRVNMRHGVSKVRRGWRHTLGIIFHDAK